MPRLILPGILAAALLAPACASSPPHGTAAPERRPARFLPPAEPEAGKPPFAGGDGSSLQKAVVILADNEQAGVNLEYRWIFDHFGRFRKKGVGLVAQDGRHYDVFTFELPDGSEQTVFFDITRFLGKMAPD
jgi:hypothetical protein